MNTRLFWGPLSGVFLLLTACAYPLFMYGYTPRIAQSTYDFFSAAKPELWDYGLYTYVILPSALTHERNVDFLEFLFKTTIDTKNARIQSRYVNVMYIPSRSVEDARTFITSRQSFTRAAVGDFVADGYDYAIAQGLLSQFCGTYVDACQGQISQGPYLVTYARPAWWVVRKESTIQDYLFLDLSKIHQQAFGEFLTTYKKQIQKGSFSKRTSINTLRLNVLNITLRAADWLFVVQEGIAGIIGSAQDE